MPKEDQKILVHLVHRMQNGMCLTIGPLNELNYEMASQVLLVLNIHLKIGTILIHKN